MTQVASTQVVLVADTHCYLCSERLRKGVSACWQKGLGIAHPTCQAGHIGPPTSRPDPWKEPLETLREALPGIELSVTEDGRARVDLVPSGELKLVICLSTRSHIELLGTGVKTPKNGLETEDLLIWLDEKLVPYLYEHAQCLRGDLAALEKSLGF